MQRYAPAALLTFLLWGAIHSCFSKEENTTLRSCSQCQLINEPVCSSTSITFMNGCLASCQGVVIIFRGACPGTYNFSGPSIFPRGPLVVSAKTISKYYSDGFFYTGIVPTSSSGRDLNSRLTFAQGIVENGSGKMSPRQGVVGTRAVRVTPEGHVYVAASQAYFYFDKPLPQSQHLSKARNITKPRSKNMFSSWQSLRTKRDNRVQELKTQDFPYAAIGQLSFQGDGYTYICTASFVSPRDVLTAAHCVYDATKNVAYSNWDFTPALNGSQAAPVGSISEYEYVTIYQNYMAGGADVDYWDMALIRTRANYSKWLGLGLMGKDELTQVTTCGYPGDKGTAHSCGLWCSNCTADPNRSDANGMTYTNSCYTYPGQSGSPLYMPDKPAVLGVLSGSPGNEYWISYWTPMDAMHRNSVMQWISAGRSADQSVSHTLAPQPSLLPPQPTPLKPFNAPAAMLGVPLLVVPGSSSQMTFLDFPTVTGTSFRESAYLISYACSGALMLLLLLA